MRYNIISKKNNAVKNKIHLLCMVILQSKRIFKKREIKYVKETS